MANRQLFQKVWKVTAFRPGPGTPGGFVAAHPNYFEDAPNGFEITKLRVQCSIEKHIGSDPNTCDVTITNLSAGMRAEIVKKPIVIRIDAGYVQDVGAIHLFTGDLRYGYSKRNGADWETHLQLGDGSRAYAGARISKSYRKGTPAIIALRDAAASLGLALPPGIAASPDLQKAFASGRCLHGDVATEMTKLLAPFGYGWSIQNGKLQILSDSTTRADEAFLISQATGLTGSPEIGAPPKDGGPATITIQNLLYPQLTPGCRLSVQSASISGTFRAERVTHTLDSHGATWTTSVEAKPA